ncbi:hypothetical protein [Nitrosomonas sp. ANs5]|uniref:hypothetical protein n=1 Tax=Nitrosomonas sp. ANs5 TaxID=3423941 RepID=UPI003D357E02
MYSLMANVDMPLLDVTLVCRNPWAISCQAVGVVERGALLLGGDGNSAITVCP